MHSAAKNFLSDRGSTLSSDRAVDDKGESPESARKSDTVVGNRRTVKSISTSSYVREYISDKCMLAVCPLAAR